MADVFEKKQIICDFLQRANAYSDHKLEQYKGQLDQAGTTNVIELIKKLEQWQSYRAFNEYTIEELQTDRLDAWFAD